VKEVNVIVCAKEIPDFEVAFRTIKIDPERKKVIVSESRRVISPFDENAIEAALRIKDENGAKVTVLSMGAKVSPSVLRKAIAVGADNLILVEDQNFKDLDSYSTAYVLSTAIKKIGEYDLILTGRQAGDWDSGQVGLILGEILGIPGINLARSVEIENGSAVVEKIIPGGYELVRAGLPALATVSNEVGELRYPSMKKTLLSRRQPIDVWCGADLPIDIEVLRKKAVLDLAAPPDMGRQCHYIEGSSSEEKGENLAVTLKEII